MSERSLFSTLPSLRLLTRLFFSSSESLWPTVSLLGLWGLVIVVGYNLVMGLIGVVGLVVVDDHNVVVVNTDDVDHIDANCLRTFKPNKQMDLS